MQRDDALLNAIAGFLDRAALGASTWSTPQEGAQLLLRQLRPIIDAPISDAEAREWAR